MQLAKESRNLCNISRKYDVGQRTWLTLACSVLAVVLLELECFSSVKKVQQSFHSLCKVFRFILKRLLVLHEIYDRSFFIILWTARMQQRTCWNPVKMLLICTSIHTWMLNGRNVFIELPSMQQHDCILHHVNAAKEYLPSCYNSNHNEVLLI